MNKKTGNTLNASTPFEDWGGKHLLIKVCGMGDITIMHQLAELDVNMLGFIFYPRSPRFVEGKIDPLEIEKLPQDIRKAGVFVNAHEATILQKADEFYLDTIQLHGNESPELCKTLKENGYTIMKAFNLTKNNNYKAYAPYCDFFLFDTPSERHGGTGEKFDWSLLDTYKGKTPFLLSGGIGPDDAEEVLQIKHSKLAGIDINSKFEISPGLKDIKQIEKFLQEFPPNPLKGEQNTTKSPKGNFKGSTNNTNSTQNLKMHYGVNPILFEFAKQMRANPTEAEDFLWKQLSGKQFNNWRFRRQHPISYFIADFYSHKAKLIIEVDGGYHNIPKQYEYDKSRDNELEEFGLKVLRFTNEQILFDIEGTLQKIEKSVKQRINEHY